MRNMFASHPPAPSGKRTYPTYSPTEPSSASGGLPVVVVLPGRGSTARTAFDELHLHAFLAAELARHGGAAGRSDPFYPNARRLAAAVPGPRAHWADGGHDQCLWRLVAPQETAFVVSALLG